MTLERRSLEEALVANPTDLAAHSAYADYLMEHNDPRGEFIRTQLALGDDARSKEERDALRKREATLLEQHAREWLGDAGRFLVGSWSGDDKPYRFRFELGWVDYVRVLPVPEAIIAAIARSPEFRLLSHLEVVYDMRYHPFDFDQFTEGPNENLRDGEPGGEVYDATTTLPDLIGSAYLTNLRVLKYGFSDHGDLQHSTMVDPFGNATAQHVIDLLKQCPRLEKLYLNTDLRNIEALFASPQLGNVRLLQYYYGTTHRYDRGDELPPYPLSTLAENTTLTNLHTLRFHPGRDTVLDLDEIRSLLESPHLPALKHLQLHMTTNGDEIAELIVRSGVLKRLSTLDLSYGGMTDDGARILAACPDLKSLLAIDLTENALTQSGIRELFRTGVPVTISSQHQADDNSYLYHVDAE